MAASKKRTTIPEDKLRLYEQLIETLPGVDTKSNFGAGYTAVNGNMYTTISKHGVVGIRLPAQERAEFIERYDAELFRGDPSWPPAKEYVAVPDRLLEDTGALAPYVARSYEYALSLKPKPARKRPPK
jgi:TfoX N-terminal domain